VTEIKTDRLDGREALLDSQGILGSESKAGETRRNALDGLLKDMNAGAGGWM